MLVFSYIVQRVYFSKNQLTILGKASTIEDDNYKYLAWRMQDEKGSLYVAATNVSGRTFKNDE